ncbi:MAG TPA: IS701 family transposase, partial [Ktedonobacteraceae bacterium]|nr:IS701 family transposase [Ktedonobacteraceae bacterium]
GLLSDLPHKTCETIADVIAGTSLERLQHLLTDAAWDPLELDEARVKRLLELHPVTEGILVFDDTGLPKKGSASVGVAPQYSGTLGKIGSCQIVVSAEYLADDPASSTPFHWPISAQLFLPESWIQDAERRKQAQVPEEISQHTKPEIALGLLDRARLWGVPIQAVVVDAGYGDNPNFLRGLDSRQVPYVCAVESTFGCRFPDEVQATAAQTPVYRGRGQPRKPRPAPLYTVKELIAALPASAWQTISWREGTKGTMQTQAVAVRVHWATGSSLHSASHSRVHTGPEGWLLAERQVPKTAEANNPQPTQDVPQEKEEEKIKYWFSVLPEDVSLQRLVLLAHARWVVEQFYARCQTGMRFGSLSGTELAGTASPPGPRHARLQLSHAPTSHPPSSCWEGFFPPPLREARCLACIGRCCSGSSRISFAGCSPPSSSIPSVPDETNRVVLG